MESARTSADWDDGKGSRRTNPQTDLINKYRSFGVRPHDIPRNVYSGYVHTTIADTYRQVRNDTLSNSGFDAWIILSQLFNALEKKI